MTNRIVRVRSLLKQEIGNVLEREFDFPGLLVTVSDVDVTPDLRQAHVFIGILGGSPRDQEDAFTKVKKKGGKIGQRVFSRVTLKFSPKLHFRRDDSAERGVNLVNLMLEIDELPKAPPLEEEEEA